MKAPFRNSAPVWLLLFLVGYSANLSSQESGNLKQLFKDPPVTMRPYVWWHWMGPNFSKEGITRDLEAMQEAGIGGATIFNLTSAVQESHAPMQNNPWPDQTYRSPAYWDALRHAASEAQRLGLEIGLHNTVGYSTTGGPWIDEERSMQRLVWSDTTIDGPSGGTIRLKVQKPDKLTTLDRLKLTTLLPTQIDHPFFSKKASIKSQWFLVKNSVS